MILYRYFAREILYTTLAVAGVVLVIAMGWRFSGYLNEAARGGLTRDVLFIVMAYRLPGFLELIIPISFFLSIMLVYGRLYVDSEMIVMESCGMSPARLIMMTLGLAAVVMLLTGSLSMWLKPGGEARLAGIFEAQRKLTEFDTLVAGKFQTLRSGKRVTYTREIDRDEREFFNVFINEYKQTNFYGPKDVITIVADSGRTRTDSDGNRFLVLQDGRRYSGQPGRHDYQVIRYEEYGQLLEQDDPAARYRDKTALPTSQLYQDWTVESVAELHWRVSVILMVPVLAILAVPLSRVNPRQGRFTRLVPGMILGFLYIASLSVGRSAIEKEQIPQELGLWWIHGIFLVVAIILIKLDAFSEFYRRFMHGKPR